MEKIILDDGIRKIVDIGIKMPTVKNAIYQLF